jgi:hypothetical protein
MTKARDLSNIISGGFTVADLPTLTASEIPNLDASKIVSGDIASARLSLATETKPIVSSVSPTVITNDATNIVITGQNFIAIPRVDVINTATGIWYSVNTVTRDSATQLTVNLALAVDAGTYRIRVENPDGNAGISSANFLTVSDAPTWTTGAGSLGSVAGGLNGAVATVSAGGDSIVYSETTNVLTNASLANCSLNSSTGAITTTDFDGSSTSPRTHTFTIRATDAQSQTTDREFSLTSSYADVLPSQIDSSDWSHPANGGSNGGFNDTNYYGTAFTVTSTSQITKTAPYEHPIFSKYSIRANANHETILQVYNVASAFKSDSTNSFFQMGLIWGESVTGLTQNNSVHAIGATATGGLNVGNGIYWVGERGDTYHSFYNGGANQNSSGQSSTNRESQQNINWNTNNATLIIKPDNHSSDARKITLYFGDTRVYTWTQLIPASSTTVNWYIGMGYPNDARYQNNPFNLRYMSGTTTNIPAS